MSPHHSRRRAGQPSAAPRAQTSPICHEQVFVANARKALGSMMGLSSADRAEGRGEAADEDGEGPTTDSLEENNDDPIPAEAESSETEGAEEFAFLAETALQQHREHSNEENSDVDAMDARDADEVTSHSPPRAPQGLPLFSASPSPPDRSAGGTAAGEGHTERKKRVVSYRTTFGEGGFTGVNADESAASYTPVDLGGLLYRGELAKVLTAAAEAKGFLSPVWATRDALCRHRIAVAEGGSPKEEGVVITSLQRPFTLFNLEQTDLPQSISRSCSAAGLHSWLTHKTTPSLDARPRGILGSYLPPTVADALKTHPRYAELSEACPLWIGAHDVYSIGAELREGEETDFALLPHEEGGAFAKKRCEYLASHPDERRDVEAQSQRLGVDLTTHTVFFSVHQLADRHRFLCCPRSEEDEEAAGEKEVPPGRGDYDMRFFSGVDLSGRRFAVAQGFLMREYCRQYGFRDVGVQLWVGERALEGRGGRPLDTPRGLRGCVADHAKSDGRRPATTAAAEGEEERGDAGGGVVPPPFTVLWQGRVLTLYNADHTDIKELLWEEYRKRREALALQRPPLPSGATTAEQL